MPKADGGDWHFCWEFVKGANWTTDGISVHMSQAGPGLPTGRNGYNLCHNTGPSRSWLTHREIPRTEGGKQIKEELGWSDQPGATTPPIFMDRAWKLNLGFDQPVLQGAFENKTYNTPVGVTCRNPNFGYGALDPDFSDVGLNSPGRYDNYAWRLRAGTQFANGIGIMFMSTSLSSQPIPLPSGDWWLNLADPLFQVGPVLLGTLSGTGEVTLTLPLGANSSKLRKDIQGLVSLSVQGIAIKGSVLEFSNVHTMRPIMLPGKSKADAVDSKGKLISKPITSRFIRVRNDGHTKLTVQQMVGSVPRGLPTVVGSRAAALIIGMPGSNGVKFTSAATKAQNFIYEYL